MGERIYENVENRDHKFISGSLRLVFTAAIVLAHRTSDPPPVLRDPDELFFDLVISVGDSFHRFSG